MSKTDGNLDLSKFAILQKIGEGGFGQVYLVQDQETSIKFAAKISKNPLDGNSEEEKMNLSREVNYNAGMNHPSILKFIGYSPFDFNQDPKPVIVSEFSKNGSLSDILDLERCGRSIEGWDSTKKLIMIYGVASGMMYLHSNEILHRDLKPQNILTDDRLFPKIGDFGLSKKKHNRPETATFESKIELKGTPIYIAPEIFETEQYSKAGDVYAFGLIVYEIMTLEIPFKNLNFLQIYKEVSIKGNRPPFVLSIGKAYRDLIERCWSQEPSLRPTFEEIVAELEENKDFITDLVEENDFIDYVEFIKQYPSSFSNKQVINIESFIRNPQSKTFQKVDISKYAEDDSKKSIFSTLIGLFKKGKMYPAQEFKKLNQKCKELVVEAENDPNKQLFIGQCLIEGKNDFPTKIELGVKYLEQSIAGGNLKSVIYFCQKLIKGDIIPQDLKKAKKYLSKYFNKNDQTIINLYGKVLYKEENYSDAFKHFEKYAKEGDSYCMYKYGRMLMCGVGIKKNNEEEGLRYLNLSKNKQNHKSELYLLALEQMSKIQSFPSLLPEMKDFFIIQIVKYNINKFYAEENSDKVLIANKVIEMKYKYTQKFFSDDSVDFINTLLTFDDISIEIFYPSKIFISILNRVSKLNNLYNKQVNIIIFISGIKSISNTFENKSLINKVIIYPPLKTIENNAFKGCSSLRQITIPSSVTSIGFSAFKGCSSLRQITIPSSVTYIGYYAFSECSSLTQITIPSSVTSIERSAFNGCSSLTQITIPSSVTSIESSAFNGCSSLTQITIPSSVTSIGFNSFEECSSLTQITIPSSVFYIGDYAFKGCSSLTQITIPSSVNHIGDYAFYGCLSLTQITVQSSFTGIGLCAFDECPLLKQISTPLSISNIKDYIIESSSSDTKITIPPTVKSIGSYAFVEYNSVTHIMIPDSVTSIHDNAFNRCSSLTQISIPSSVTSIGRGAFVGCSSLVQITIPSSVTDIGSGAFLRCSSLVQITIPSSVTKIDDYTFDGCSSLTQITIPLSVTKIGSFAFNGCSSLTQIIIPSSVTEIGEGAIAACTSLTQITIPSSIASKYTYPSNIKIIIN